MTITRMTDSPRAPLALASVEREPTIEPRGNIATVGIFVYAVSAVVLGLVGLAWRDFAAVWQPIPEELPGRVPLAILTATAFIASGIGLTWRRSAKVCAATLGLLYFTFAVLWLPRVIAYPRILGTWNGVFEQLALVAAALTYLASLDAPNGNARLRRAARVLFGMCLLSFGATHFDALKPTADLVPTWLPPSQRFWAAATGVFHIAAGLAILTDVWVVLASRLFVLMLIGFGALVWSPRLLANAHDHTVWAGNAINLALIGAAWLMADSIAASASPSHSGGS